MYKRLCNQNANILYIHITFIIGVCRIINVFNISILMKATRYQINLHWKRAARRMLNLDDMAY